MENEDLTKQKKILGEWALRFTRKEKETAFAQGKLHTYIKEAAKSNKPALARELQNAVLNSKTMNPVKPFFEGWQGFTSNSDEFGLLQVESGSVKPNATFFTKVKSFFKGILNGIRKQTS